MQNHFYDYLVDKGLKNRFFVTKDSKEAHSLEQVANYLNYKTVVLPDFRAIDGDDLRVYYSEYVDLYNSLHKYYNDIEIILISPIRTLLSPLPIAKYFKSVKFSLNDDIGSIAEFKDRLYRMGYSFVSMVEVEGEVSVRGDIIDIFPINSDVPYRVSMFDTLIEEVKKFNPITQKSESKTLKELEVLSLSLYMQDDEREFVNKEISKNISDNIGDDTSFFEYWFIRDKRLLTDQVVAFSDLSSEIDMLYSFKNSYTDISNINFNLYQSSRYKMVSKIEDFNTFISLHKDKKIELLSKNRSLLRNIDTEGIFVVESSNIVNIISKDKAIVSINIPEKRRVKRSNIIVDELKIGDYIVHNEYGIGLFNRIIQVKIEGSTQDFLELKYSGIGNNLLIPVSNLNLINRYVYSSNILPILDTIGKGSFKKLKAKVKEDLFKIAKSIVDTAAKRELLKAPKFRVSHEELLSFQNNSGFTYTQDQYDTVNSIKERLNLGFPMDMLLVGDVGFGKTEVAINAIYMAIKNGYQVALIVPTTLLSMQHFTTIYDRLNSIFKVARYDKFINSRDKTSIKKHIKDGLFDLVIGTHSLYSLEFKNLGLVIIDEEHKFGVVQKDKLKEKYFGSHILSMSATPIPRSLNLALSSVKTISYLQTPPKDRLGVRTVVKEYSDELIREIINRELKRGGLLFYIFNSISAIEAKKIKIEAIFPNIKIAILHSKVDSNSTDEIMRDFANREYDILLCTTIVGSGIHIPSANSIIVENAENFGLADLHQIRGRVGRSNVEGFCYLIVSDKDELTVEASKRLVAIEKNSSLGSGGVLAQHDLEIRGGGNILGAQQSGKIKNIGYSLYLTMLEEAINIQTKKMGNENSDGYGKNVDMMLSVNSFISPELIEDEKLRIELYKRLNSTQNIDDIIEIESEMIDRFGKLDSNTEQFCNIMMIKIEAMRVGIVKLSNYKDNITLIYDNGDKKVIKAEGREDSEIITAITNYLKV